MPTVVELPTPSKSSSSDGGGVCGAGAGIFTTWLQVVAVHPCKSSSNKGKVPPSSSSRQSELRSVSWAGPRLLTPQGLPSAAVVVEAWPTVGGSAGAAGSTHPSSRTIASSQSSADCPGGLWCW